MNLSRRPDLPDFNASTSAPGASGPPTTAVMMMMAPMVVMVVMPAPSSGRATHGIFMIIARLLLALGKTLDGPNDQDHGDEGSDDDACNLAAIET